MCRLRSYMVVFIHTAQENDNYSENKNITLSESLLRSFTPVEKPTLLSPEKPLTAFD